MRQFQSRFSIAASLSWGALGAALMLGGACGDSGTDGANDAGGVSADAGNGGTTADAGTGTGRDAALPPPAGDGGTPGKTFDAGTDPNRNTITAAGLCDRFATLQCAAEQSCCSDVSRTFDACKAAQLDICRSQGHLDEAAAVPAAGFDPSKAKQAFERFEALAAVCDPSVTAWVLAVQSGFRGIFTGTLGAKASCFPSPPSTDLGVAAGFALACLDPETTSCLPTTAFTWSCDPRGAAGSPCFTDANCAGETYCTNTDASLAGIGKGMCAPRKEVGEACVGTGECKSLTCVAKKCAPTSANGAYCLGR